MILARTGIRAATAVARCGGDQGMRAWCDLAIKAWPKASAEANSQHGVAPMRQKPEQAEKRKRTGSDSPMGSSTG